LSPAPTAGIAPISPAEWRRSGVALLDAIVAAVILGVALAAIIGLQGRAISAQSVGEQLATAARLADEQLNLVLARGPDDYARRFPMQGPCDEPFESFRYALTISGGMGNQPYAVGVVISWETASGPRSIEVRTLMAPRPGELPERRPDQAVDRAGGGGLP
jgi:Tfp pilus assembly protein PilV